MPIKIQCGTKNGPQFHKSWMHLHMDKRRPDWLDFGLKDAKGTSPTFTTMYRSEVIALRDNLNLWLKLTNHPVIEGSLFDE